MTSRLSLLSLPLLLVLLLFSPSEMQAQKIIARGGIVPEVMVVADSGRIYVSWKAADTVIVPEKRNPKAFYNATDLPLAAKGVTFGSDYFAGHIVALSPSGEILWTRKYGRSRSSAPFGIASDHNGGVIAAARAPQSPDKILVERINPDGDLIWGKRFDSLTDAARVVVTDQPYLSVLAWTSEQGYIRNADSTISAAEFYYVSTLRLDTATGEPFLLDGYPARTDEKTLSAMMADGFATPLSSRHMDWFTWRGDSLFLYVKKGSQDGAYMLPLPEEADRLIVQEGLFRDGEYVAVGSVGGSRDILAAGVRYARGEEGTEVVRLLPKLKGMSILSASFNNHGGITVAGTKGNQIAIVTLDEKFEPVKEIAHTIESDGEVAVAAIAPGTGKSYHLFYLTEGKGERLLWHQIVDGE